MKNYKSLFLINMEKASSCVVFTNTYIPVTYMVFLTVEVIWKLATIRVINSSHKHSHAPVASLFLAYILTSWPEQKRKATATTKEKVKKYYTPPNKKSWFQINDFEKKFIWLLSKQKFLSYCWCAKCTLCSKTSCTIRIQWGHAKISQSVFFSIFPQVCQKHVCSYTWFHTFHLTEPRSFGHHTSGLGSRGAQEGRKVLYWQGISCEMLTL